MPVSFFQVFSLMTQFHAVLFDLHPVPGGTELYKSCCVMQASAHTQWGYLWLYLTVTGRTSSAIDLALCLSQYNRICGALAICHRNSYTEKYLKDAFDGTLAMRRVYLAQVTSCHWSSLFFSLKASDEMINIKILLYRRWTFFLPLSFPWGSYSLKKSYWSWRSCKEALSMKLLSAGQEPYREIRLWLHIALSKYMLPKKEFLPCSVVSLPPLSVDTIIHMVN